MKNIILIIGLLVTLPAFADSAKVVVSRFKATLAVNTQNLKITGAEVSVSNQFCNFWGTTCAGGPKDSEVLPVVLRESADGKIVTVVNEFEYELGSVKLGNRFSSCDVTLAVSGQNNEGKVIYGEYSLVRTNDKNLCSSPAGLKKVIDAALASPLTVENDNDWIIRIK